MADLLVNMMIVGILTFLIFCLCGWCCRRETKGQVFTTVAVVETSTIAPPPVGAGFAPVGGYPQAGYPPTSPYPLATQYPVANSPNPPYPTQQRMPHPAVAAPMGFNIGHAPYPTGGPIGGPQPPYPMYPNNGMREFDQNPPTYDEATGPNAYRQQAPFNPNFK